MSPSLPLSEIIALLTRTITHEQIAATQEFTNMSLSQITYLETIERLHNPTPTELAQALQLSKPSVTAAVDRLVKLGFVRKVRSDADRRSFHLHLTAKGEQFGSTHTRIHTHLARQLTRGLTVEEITELERILNKVIAHAEQSSES